MTSPAFLVVLLLEMQGDGLLREGKRGDHGGVVFFVHHAGLHDVVAPQLHLPAARVFQRRAGGVGRDCRGRGRGRGRGCGRGGFGLDFGDQRGLVDEDLIASKGLGGRQGDVESEPGLTRGGTGDSMHSYYNDEYNDDAP